MALPRYGLPADPPNVISVTLFRISVGGAGLSSVADPRCQRTIDTTRLADRVRDGISLGLLVSIWGLIDKVLGPLAWSPVVIYGGFLLGSLYCLYAAAKTA